MSENGKQKVHTVFTTIIPFLYSFLLLLLFPDLFSSPSLQLQSSLSITTTVLIHHIRRFIAPSILDLTFNPVFSITPSATVASPSRSLYVSRPVSVTVAAFERRRRVICRETERRSSMESKKLCSFIISD